MTNDEVVYEPTHEKARFIVQVYNRYHLWEEAGGPWYLDAGATTFVPYRTLAKAKEMADLLASEIDNEVRVVRREISE